MSYKIGIISNKGNLREKNEDSVWVRSLTSDCEDILLAVVADGMGGLDFGERASQHVTKQIDQWWQETDKLHSKRISEIQDELCFLLEEVHRTIREEANESMTIMGTTISLVFVKGEQFFILQAGDSRVYLLRKQRAYLLTEDQTWCYEQVKAGLLTEEEVSLHPKRHVLSNAIGAKEEFYLERTEGMVQKGDRLILCSDGYYSYINIRELMKRHRSPQKILELSEKRILKERADDNLSAIMLEL